MGRCLPLPLPSDERSTVALHATAFFFRLAVNPDEHRVAGVLPPRIEVAVVVQVLVDVSSKGRCLVVCEVTSGFDDEDVLESKSPLQVLEIEVSEFADIDRHIETSDENHLEGYAASVIFEAVLLPPQELSSPGHIIVINGNVHEPERNDERECLQEVHAKRGAASLCIVGLPIFVGHGEFSQPTVPVRTRRRSVVLDERSERLVDPLVNGRHVSRIEARNVCVNRNNRHGLALDVCYSFSATLFIVAKTHAATCSLEPPKYDSTHPNATQPSLLPFQPLAEAT